MSSIFRRWASALLTAAFLCTAPGPSLACDGDCRGEGAVSIDDLIRAVNIALGSAPVSSCEPADRNGDGAVTIEELIAGVQHALDGCALGPAGEVLIDVHDFQLDEYDLGTGATTTIVPPTHARVNGQPCLLPGGSGEFVVGDYTGVPEQAPSWSVFSPDGTFLRRVPLPVTDSDPPIGNPVGCAVDSQG